MTSTGLLHSFFEALCPPDSALLTGEGEILHIRSQSPTAYGTLNLAAQNVMKYLPLRPGDVALLNDPYSGGSTLNEYTFVTKVLEAGPQSLWLALRKTYGLRKISDKSIEEEGLRIPPTPIYQGRQLNQMILTAMSAHPLCPPNFTSWLTAVCKEIESLIQKFNKSQEKQRFSFSKNAMKDYLELCRDIVKEKISESASGDARVEVHLDSKEMIRLHMEIHDGHVQMDFTGTTASKLQFLTDSATYGICFYALAQFYQFTNLANTGSFSVLQVVKPSTCLLNAKYPAPLSAGSLSVKAALQTALAMAFGEIHAKKKKALCSFCPIEIEVFNEQAEPVLLRLPGGGGASMETASSQFALGETLCESFSLEKLERDWPLQVQLLDYRIPAASKGEIRAGRGLSFKLQATAPVKIRWRTDLTGRENKAKNSVAGEASAVSMLTLQGEEKSLPAVGQLEMKTGEVLTLHSSTGGGWNS